MTSSGDSYGSSSALRAFMFLKLCLPSRLGREFFAGKASPGLEVSKVGCTAGQEKASTNFCLFFSSLCCAVLSHSVVSDSLQHHGL